MQPGFFGKTADAGLEQGNQRCPSVSLGAEKTRKY
jgi:hypothetical protein